MKKKINILLMVLTMVFVAVLLVSCGNGEVVEETAEKTGVAEWFENNLGWFVGIPTGVVLSNVLEFLLLFKKSKNYAQDLFHNNETRKSVAKTVNDFSETNAKLGKFVTKTEQTDLALDKKIDSTIEKVEQQAEKFVEVQNQCAVVKTEVEALLEVLSLIASQDKDLVSSGVAEKVNKIVESVKTK